MKSEKLERLQKLHELHKIGALTEEEFEIEKKKILADKSVIIDPESIKNSINTVTESVKEGWNKEVKSRLESIKFVKNGWGTIGLISLFVAVGFLIIRYGSFVEYYALTYSLPETSLQQPFLKPMVYIFSLLVPILFFSRLLLLFSGSNRFVFVKLCYDLLASRILLFVFFGSLLAVELIFLVQLIGDNGFSFFYTGDELFGDELFGGGERRYFPLALLIVLISIPIVSFFFIKYVKFIFESLVNLKCMRSQRIKEYPKTKILRRRKWFFWILYSVVLALLLIPPIVGYVDYLEDLRSIKNQDIRYVRNGKIYEIEKFPSSITTFIIEKDKDGIEHRWKSKEVRFSDNQKRRVELEFEQNYDAAEITSKSSYYFNRRDGINFYNRDNCEYCVLGECEYFSLYEVDDYYQGERRRNNFSEFSESEIVAYANFIKKKDWQTLKAKFDNRFKVAIGNYLFCRTRSGTASYRGWAGGAAGRHKLSPDRT